MGARLDLGTTNAVNAATKLVGSVAGPSVQMDNNSAGSGAAALDLRVEPGKAPLKVDSEDSVAFARANTPTYVSTNAAVTGPPRWARSHPTGLPATTAIASVTVKRTDTNSARVSIRATCLDFPPLRP